MQEEQFLIRDRAYGVWHRTRSISRFIGAREAKALTMADLDSVLFVEFGCSNKLPLALVEVARDIGQDKASGVIHQLARMAGLPAFVALYSPASRANPASPAWHDIEEFRVRRVWPKPENAGAGCHRLNGPPRSFKSGTGSSSAFRLNTPPTIRRTRGTP